VLQFSAASALERLRNYKNNLRILYIAKEGISEESVDSLIIRDTKECKDELRELLHKIRMEKSRIRMSLRDKTLCS
jgi:hypothetical protein